MGCPVLPDCKGALELTSSTSIAERSCSVAFETVISGDVRGLFLKRRVFQLTDSVGLAVGGGLGVRLRRGGILRR